jgi:adenine deaminase
MATRDAAALLRLDDRGVIAPGKLADLLIVDGDPSKDIAAVDNIDSVWRRGKKVSDARWFKPPHTSSRAPTTSRAPTASLIRSAAAMTRWKPSNSGIATPCSAALRNA